MFADQNQLRQMWCDVYARMRAGEAMPVGLDAAIADAITQHPEYHAVLADPETALAEQYSPERGQTNPFLHMGMHLAVREQVGTDRPAGIRREYERLCRTVGDAHNVEHQMFECLGRVMYDAQRAGQLPDESLYLECVKKL